MQKYLQEILYDTFDSENYVQMTYTPVKLLGKGSFSEVLKCINLQTQEIVAIKVINKQKLKRNLIQILLKEALFLSQLHHPNIVKFIEHRESLNKIYFIMQLIEGRTLTQLMNEENLTNEQISNIIQQLATGLSYIHSQNIIHRDFKPDNIIIEQLDEDYCSLKIIDFGLSFQKQYDIMLTYDNCGTLIYMAPEIIEGSQYNQKVDIWSLGIIQYALYSRGKHPVWNDKSNCQRKQYISEILQFEPEYAQFPDRMEETAQHFFFKTAARLPENRMTAQQCLFHPWIVRNEEVESPRTINDVIKEIEKMKKIEQRFKCLIILMYLKSNSIFLKQEKFDDFPQEIDFQFYDDLVMSPKSFFRITQGKKLNLDVKQIQPSPELQSRKYAKRMSEQNIYNKRMLSQYSLITTPTKILISPQTDKVQKKINQQQIIGNTNTNDFEFHKHKKNRQQWKFNFTECYQEYQDKYKKPEVIDESHLHLPPIPNGYKQKLQNFPNGIEKCVQYTSKMHLIRNLEK